ncbi:MAG: hypothetical protein V1755_05650 [Chloroflexota bacterium]
MQSDRATLASLPFLRAVVGVLAASGAICPKCGHGTRKTSKRWAECKRCGVRVERRELPEPEPAK